MFKKTLYILTFFTIIIYSCSDVPLSYEKYDYHAQILGYWVEEDNSMCTAFELDNLNNVKITTYVIEKNAFGKKELKTNVYNNVNFTNLKIGGVIKNFFSVEESKNKYSNYAYMIRNGKIAYCSLSENLKENGEIGDANFQTPANFQQFVINNINNPKMFTEVRVAWKISSLEEFKAKLYGNNNASESTSEEKLLLNFLGTLFSGDYNNNNSSENNVVCNQCIGRGYTLDERLQGGSDSHRCDKCGGSGWVKY